MIRFLRYTCAVKGLLPCGIGAKATIGTAAIMFPNSNIHGLNETKLCIVKKQCMHQSYKYGT